MTGAKSRRLPSETALQGWADSRAGICAPSHTMAGKVRGRFQRMDRGRRDINEKEPLGRSPGGSFPQLPAFGRFHR